MRIAAERRGDRWLAQVVHVGENLHWTEHQRIKNEMAIWMTKNIKGGYVSGWQFYFKTEEDLAFFLLRWQG